LTGILERREPEFGPRRTAIIGKNDNRGKTTC